MTEQTRPGSRVRLGRARSLARVIRFEKVTKTYPGAGAPALDEVSVDVEKGEFVFLVGASGSGKSTALRLVLREYRATSGRVYVAGKEINRLAGWKVPRLRRQIGTVFQDFRLLQSKTVAENVAFALQVTGKSPREIKRLVPETLELVGLEDRADRLPDELSGGMKQRVGIARALAMQPQVLLMDEPFGALDALTRAHLQDSLMEIHAQLGTTVIMITHDVDEAVLLSDRIVMMTNGPSATIGEILDVNVPRPRDRLALADDPTFVRCRQQVLQFLYEKQRKVEPLPKRTDAATGAARKRA